MAHRRFWLGLWLAASPLAAQVPNLSTYHPGNLRLELAPGMNSQLSFNLRHLDEVICGLTGGEESRNGASKGGGGVNPPGETCRLVIANDGGPNGLAREATPVALAASAQGLALSPCGPAQVTIQPTAIQLEGAQLLDLACGEYSFRAELSTSPVGPPSVVSLLPAAPGSPTGLFTGALALRLAITYTRAGSEIELSPPSFEEVREMVLDVAGRWTVAQSFFGSPLAPADTNLVLFADRETVAESIWLKKGSCAPARHGCGRLCLVASGASVAALNGLPVY